MSGVSFASTSMQYTNTNQAPSLNKEEAQFIKDIQDLAVAANELMESSKNLAHIRDSKKLLGQNITKLDAEIKKGEERIGKLEADKLQLINERALNGVKLAEATKKVEQARAERDQARDNITHASALLNQVSALQSQASALQNQVQNMQSAPVAPISKTSDSVKDRLAARRAARDKTEAVVV